MQRKSAVQQIALFGIMVIMLFVVLSTATYAWYSANNVASVDSIVFTSSAVGQEEGLLAIGSTPTTTSTTMTFGATEDFSPMIPVNAATLGTTTYSAFVNNFNKTSEGLNDLGIWVAKVDGSPTTPTTLTCDNQTYFYVINRDPNADYTIKIDYIFDGSEDNALQDKLHIAFFIGEDAQTATLLGIASSSNIHYGAIAAGAPVADTPTMNSSVIKNTGEMSFHLDANEYAVLRLVAWLDGVDMKVAHGSKSMLFSLTFRGE